MLEASKIVRSLGFVLALILTLAGQARADIVAVAITPNPSNTFNNGQGYSLGYEFLVNSNMNVTQLGYFAPNGLSETHIVGIFDNNENLLGLTTVTLIDPVTVDFAYDTLTTPIALTAGQDYWIMATSGVSDPYTFITSSLTTNPALTYVESGFNSSGNSLLFPTALGSNPDSFFGPDFEFTPATGIPEPSSFLLFLIPITCLVIAWRKKQLTLPSSANSQ